MDEKDRKSALLEVELLKKFNHPHIVAYEESFIEDGELIIIMEYCEEGDLSHLIKLQNKKKDHFPEKVILNWFI
jgi:NIMA (never in mitosis gene a)-related kinase